MSKFLHYEQCPRCTDKGRDTRGDNCAVYSDGGKHCFACGYHITAKYSNHIPKKKEVNATLFPTDLTTDIPAVALQWLLSYGLPYSYWQPFIGWSEKDMRLVFEAGGAGVGRYFGPDNKRKWYGYGNIHKQPHVISPVENAIQKSVLVEDIVSAHKVGTVAYSIPLFGTKVFDGCIPILRFLAMPIVLWLDKDQEQTMYKKCTWLQAVTGLPVTYVSTPNDPKDCTLTSIKGKLA